MKLLLIGPEVTDINKAHNFSGVWSYYIARELRRRGVELRFDPPQHKLYGLDSIVHYQSLNLSDIDHILALGTRYFTKIPRECADILRNSCHGAVTQIHDGPIYESGIVDCTFTVKDSMNCRKHHYIGWAADPELCKPTQLKDELRILIDHPNPSPNKFDMTQQILNEVLNYAANDSNEFIHIKRLVVGGRIPYPEICKKYSKAHLFLVTHPESVGMSVLETAMCGALPLVPKGFIAEGRLATVRALTYEGEVPLTKAIAMLDIKASRTVAINNSWERVVDRMLDWFERFRK